MRPIRNHHEYQKALRLRTFKEFSVSVLFVATIFALFALVPVFFIGSISHLTWLILSIYLGVTTWLSCISELIDQETELEEVRKTLGINEDDP